MRVTELSASGASVMDGEFAAPSHFCSYHKGHKNIRRCAHLGSRFLAQVQGYFAHDVGCVDYVQAFPGSFTAQTIGYFATPEEAERLWQHGLGLLKGEVPVCPE